MDHVNIYLEDNFKGVKTQTAAVIFWIELIVKDEPFTLNGTQVLTMTPNQAAISNLIMALSRLNRECSLDIYCESQYLAAGVNEWIDNWSARMWRNSRNKTVENAAEWQLLAYMLQRHDYRLHLGEEHSYKNWMLDNLKNVELSR